MAASILNHKSGGVAFIRPCMPQGQHSQAAADKHIRYTEFASGRSQRLAIKSAEPSGAMLATYNSSNYGLTEDEVASLTCRIAAESEIAARSPNIVTVIALGDFFSNAADAPTHLRAPGIDKGFKAQPCQRGVNMNLKRCLQLNVKSFDWSAGCPADARRFRAIDGTCFADGLWLQDVGREELPTVLCTANKWSPEHWQARLAPEIARAESPGAPIQKTIAKSSEKLAMSWPRLRGALTGAPPAWQISAVKTPEEQQQQHAQTGTGSAFPNRLRHPMGPSKENSRCQITSTGSRGFVTIKGNEGTKFLEAYTPFTAFMSKVDKALKESEKRIAKAAQFLSQKTKELSHASSPSGGPLREAEGELKKMIPKANAAHRGIEKIMANVAASKKEYSQKELAEKNAYLEAKERKEAEAILSFASAKMEAVEAAGKRLEEVVRPLTALEGEELEAFGTPASTLAEAKTVQTSAAEIIREARDSLKEKLDVLGKVPCPQQAQRELRRLTGKMEAAQRRRAGRRCPRRRRPAEPSRRGKGRRHLQRASG
ncbi:unnamed protein product [Prorocentrum cordatum]|uniref:Uncharacterized protein n=1 Tax=Prorocentrum cordatum TaxID=2364126 RepID=A0ABN9SG19_9DINO|nr:unnamed protein product [Polarella glacialis]